MNDSAQLQLVALRAYASGYRGCLMETDRYLFFQCSRNGSVKRLKEYPMADFIDLDHFKAMMLKFMIPTTFLRPPMPIEALTMAELDRVHAQLGKNAGAKSF